MIDPHILWKKLEKAKRESKCEDCNRNFDLVIHHKDKNRKNNSLDNLQILCFLCHRKIHGKKSSKAGRPPTGKPECVRITVSVPKKVFDTIEQLRGHTKRSTFIQDLLQKSLQIEVEL